MRTTRTHRAALVLAGGVLAVMLAGCGGDVVEPEAGSATPAPMAEGDAPAADTDEATDETTDEATDEEATDGEAAADAAGTAAAEVALRDDDGFVFDPTEVTVAAGDTVTWMHEGRISHTVTAEDGSFDSGTLAAGETFEVTFDDAGTYPYFCNFHGSMRGTVTVE